MMVRVELSDEAWSLMVSGQLKIPGISLRSETLVVLEGAARIEWTKPTPRTIRSVVCRCR